MMNIKVNEQLWQPSSANRHLQKSYKCIPNSESEFAVRGEQSKYPM